MKTALQFSGGADSLACLWLCKEVPDMTVYWVKTDGAYEDMEGYVRTCCEQASVPLKVVNSNRGIAEHGYPKDSNPDSVFGCCSRGLWEPLAKAMKDDGIEAVIRGQRDDDFLKAPITSGHIEDGIMYLFPLANWTRQSVMAYLQDTIPGLIHDCYKQGELTGRDCWDCTGYLFDNAQRILNLPADKREFVIKEIKNGNV